LLIMHEVIMHNSDIAKLLASPTIVPTGNATQILKALVVLIIIDNLHLPSIM